MSVINPSLLWPAGYHSPLTGHRATINEADLGLGGIVRALDFKGQHSRVIAGLLTALVSNPAVITYRQDVLQDLLGLPRLADTLTELLPPLSELANLGRGKSWSENSSLQQVASRLAELDIYVNCVESLWLALEAAGAELKAAGWLSLRAVLAATRQDADYARLVAELPLLQSQLEKAGSVTLGINLDGQLRPESVTIVSVNQGRFNGKGGLLDRLLGERAAGETVRGIGGLYKAAENGRNTPEHELFRELERLLERVAVSVAEALARYTRLSCTELASLEPELAFYLGAARLSEELRAQGLVLCRPTPAPAEERAGEIKGNYNLELALRVRTSHRGTELGKFIVPNDVNFGPGATIFILTGPNSGGKTTYIRAVGQAQVLFQAGLLVPGQAARISPVDGIFTHFATAERPAGQGGRLAEELERLAQLFQAASRASLVLLNEPLTSTDHVSARALSRDLLAGLRLLGARAIYVTHVHELSEDALTLNGVESEVGVVNLVAGATPQSGKTGEEAPTYTIAPGRPLVSGYAAELARQYGLSLAQIRQALRDRGIGG